eukprot:COSAG05_NODE_14122_length_407_cov_0.844156_1_plen_135_part_11
MDAPPTQLSGTHGGLRLHPAPGGHYTPTWIDDGQHYTAGVLESSLDGIIWKPVCDDNFDENNNAANVVCKQLGLAYGLFQPQHQAHCDINVQTSDFGIDDVKCQNKCTVRVVDDTHPQGVTTVFQGFDAGTESEC